MRRPRVITRCVADTYAASNERIIEFGARSAGGLISFRELDDGTLLIDVYRTSGPVTVRHEEG